MRRHPRGGPRPDRVGHGPAGMEGIKAMKLPRLSGWRGARPGRAIVVLVESYNEFDTQAGLVDRLCRRHGWTPHFVGQRNYDPRTHHLAGFFRDRHDARFSNLTLWGLWSEAGGGKAVYRDHADKPWTPLVEALPKKRRVPLSEAGCELLLRHLDPALALCNERHLTLVDPTFSPSKLNVHEPVIVARSCHEGKIPLIAIMTGSNMFFNPDFAVYVGQGREVEAWAAKRVFSAGETPLAAKALLVPSLHDAEKHLEGCPRERMHVTGSLRFNPQWIDVLLTDALSAGRLGPPDLAPAREGMVNVLLLTTPEKYNVDVDQLRRTVEGLASHPGLQVVVKSHTRRTGSDGLSEYDVETGGTIHFKSDVATSLLVEWADVVISYGTSACLQAVLRGRPLVDPVYLHGNTLIPTHHGACWAPPSVEVLVGGLADQARAPLPADRRAGVEALKRQMVFADRATSYDILGEAADLVDRLRENAFRDGF